MEIKQRRKVLNWLEGVKLIDIEREDMVNAITRRGSKVSPSYKLKVVREKLDNIARERSDFHLSERVEAVENREVSDGKWSKTSSLVNERGECREAVATRCKGQKEMMMKEKERKEQEFRALAAKSCSESKMTVAAEAAKERERIREEPRQERERERRLEEIETFYDFLPQSEQCEESREKFKKFKSYYEVILDKQEDQFFWEKFKSYYEPKFKSYYELMLDKQEDQFFEEDMRMESIISTKAKVTKLWEDFCKGIIKKPSLEDVDRRFVMEHYGKEALYQLQSSPQTYLPTLLKKLGLSEMLLKRKISNRPRSNPGITRIPDEVLAQFNEQSFRQGGRALMTNYVKEVEKETNEKDGFIFAQYLRDHGAGRLSREELEKAVMERFGPRVLQGLILRMEMVQSRDES